MMVGLILSGLTAKAPVPGFSDNPVVIVRQAITMADLALKMMAET